MSWQPKSTLIKQFESARETLKQVLPRWKLLGSRSGYLVARQNLINEMRVPRLLWLHARPLR
jgi:hypothetical protein